MHLASLTLVSHSMGGRPLLEALAAPGLAAMGLPGLKVILVATDAPQSDVADILPCAQWTAHYVTGPGSYPKRSVGR